MNYICIGCGHNCKLKTEYENHNLSCVFFNQDLYRKLREDTQKKVSTIEVLEYLKNDFLRTIIMYYDAKFEKLEQENTKLKREMISLKNTMNLRTKKKITEILNHIQIQGPTFYEWVDTLTISAEDLEVVFEEDLLEGMKKAINKTITDRLTFPIRAFSEKKGVLYVYVYNKETKTKEWNILTQEDTNKLLYTLSRRFIKRFLDWSKTNEEKINGNESKMDEHILYMRKINGGNKSDEHMMNEIKEWLFQTLKVNMEYIV
jgi:hypothetical protein